MLTICALLTTLIFIAQYLESQKPRIVRTLTWRGPGRLDQLTPGCGEGCSVTPGVSETHTELCARYHQLLAMNLPVPQLPQAPLGRFDQTGAAKWLN